MSVLPFHLRRKRRGPMRKRPSLDFSLTGLFYVTMMVFMMVAAINSQANLLFGVCGLMAGVLAVTVIISRLVLRKLEVRRVLPDYMVVGEPATIHYQFDNLKRYWPSLSVAACELSGSEGFSKPPQAYLMHAAGGTTVTVPTQVVPTRRGLYQLDSFQLLTSFPFGFVRRAAGRRQKDTLLAYPPRCDVDSRLLSRCLSAEQSGTNMRPRRGGTDEFYGIKEYRTGENPRWIYWRRSARTGVIVSKEMTQIAPPRLLVLVDTFLHQRTLDTHAAVEQVIAMAASLVRRTVDSGLAVGLCAWSGSWTVTSPSRGKRHMRELLAVLARLPLNTSHDHEELIGCARQLLRPGTTAVLLTPRSVGSSSGQSRLNWIVIPAGSAQAAAWFRFDPGVDFRGCVPLEQARTLAEE